MKEKSLSQSVALDHDEQGGPPPPPPWKNPSLHFFQRFSTFSFELMSHDLSTATSTEATSTMNPMAANVSIHYSKSSSLRKPE